MEADVHDYLAGFGLVPVASDWQSRHQHNVLYVRNHLLDDKKIARRIATIRRVAR